MRQGTGSPAPRRETVKTTVYVRPENDMTPNFFVRGGLFFTFN
jgi:hypothetical protein